jgi:hypothetical protein
MKQLINAITAEKKDRLNQFITDINEVTELSQLTAKYGYYSYLIPKGKKLDNMSITELRAYLITRKQNATYKAIEKEVSNIKTVLSAGTLKEVKISVEWKKSRMWGANPTAEAWYSTTDGNSGYVKSESIGGCGYDKHSTAVAQVLNQINEVLKPLYIAREKNVKGKLGEFLGYGSGYGILPRIEGGVGVSCYRTIFNNIGYDFQTIASGKTFDVHTITKKA